MLPSDSEQDRLRKRRRVKALKQKLKQSEQDAARDQSKNSWQAFQQKGAKRRVAGSMKGVRKEIDICRSYDSGWQGRCLGCRSGHVIDYRGGSMGFNGRGERGLGNWRFFPLGGRHRWPKLFTFVVLTQMAKKGPFWSLRSRALVAEARAHARLGLSKLINQTGQG